MSGFGLIIILLFMLAMGGLVALLYGQNSDLAISKILMLLMQLMITAEFILALYEYPCYLADGIIFICMGEAWLAWVMFGIVGVIVLFIAAMIIPRVKWSKSLMASPSKLIVLGLLLVLLLSYTELFNGVYSFDSYEQFKETKARYEEYDNRFFPTKLIRHQSDGNEQIAMYPFDVTTAAGKLPMLYKGETFQKTDENGKSELFFYPFTYKLYEGSEPVSFEDGEYLERLETELADKLKKEQNASQSDASPTDAASPTDGAAGQTTATGN